MRHTDRVGKAMKGLENEDKPGVFHSARKGELMEGCKDPVLWSKCWVRMAPESASCMVDLSRAKLHLSKPEKRVAAIKTGDEGILGNSFSWMDGPEKTFLSNVNTERFSKAWTTWMLPPRERFE